jgi:hypothetical protein
MDDLINEAKAYYSKVSSNEILEAKQTRKNRVKLTVFNERASYKGVIWIAFDENNMYLQTEVGTHGSQSRH